MKAARPKGWDAGVHAAEIFIEFRREIGRFKIERLRRGSRT